jgi:hypothetical protein
MSCRVTKHVLVVVGEADVDEQQQQRLLRGALGLGEQAHDTRRFLHLNISNKRNK